MPRRSRPQWRRNCTARRFSKRGSKMIRATSRGSFCLKRPGVAAGETADARMEDKPGFQTAKRAWGLVPMLERFRAAGHQLHEDRVAARSRQTMGVLVLPRFSGPRGRPRAAESSGAPRGNGRISFACWAPIRRLSSARRRQASRLLFTLRFEKADSAGSRGRVASESQAPAQAASRADARSRAEFGRTDRDTAPTLATRSSF